MKFQTKRQKFVFKMTSMIIIFFTKSNQAEMGDEVPPGQQGVLFPERLIS